MIRFLPLFALLLAMPSFGQLSHEEKKQGFHPIFNGKDLDGWEGDPRLWKAVKGELVGNTDGITLDDNTFLVYKKRELGDFVFRTQVKLRNHNSGIQFRSELLRNWVVKGLQADMAEGNYWGCIYDEKGKRGVMVNGWKGKAETVVKNGDWNDYEVLADGERIEIRVNGLLTAELKDNLKMSGILALQLHKGPGMQVEFRNLRLKVIR